ncbi:MAG: hypothetical protein RIB98_00370 [Acidimicrobiales bacterium]
MGKRQRQRDRAARQAESDAEDEARIVGERGDDDIGEPQDGGQPEDLMAHNEGQRRLRELLNGEGTHGAMADRVSPSQWAAMSPKMRERKVEAQRSVIEAWSERRTERIASGLSVEEFNARRLAEWDAAIDDASTPRDSATDDRRTALSFGMGAIAVGAVLLIFQTADWMRTTIGLAPSEATGFGVFLVVVGLLALFVVNQN